MTVDTHSLVTAEELLGRTGSGRCELIEGKVICLPAVGLRHARIALKIGRLVGDFVEARGLGEAYGSEAGFILERNPDTVRAPDMAFISAGRLRGGTVIGYMEGAPDLVAEVVSPTDRRRDVAAKVAQWLEKGVRSVWVVEPDLQCVVVHHPKVEPRRFEAGEALTDEAVLPGFSVPVDRIFE